MSRVVSVKTAVMAIAFAVAAGAFVQYGAAARSEPDVTQAAHIRDRQQPVGAAPVHNGSKVVFALPEPHALPADHRARTSSIVPVRAVYAALEVPRLGTVMATPVDGCRPTLALRARADALVELAATLPCAPQKVVVIRHDILEFSVRTDAGGHIDLTIPALSENAKFALLVDNIEHAQASVTVPAVRDFDRVVLQWRGIENLQLHAFEPDATVGDAGHIWSASVPDATGRRGFVKRLGLIDADMPRMAEVFSQPVSEDSVGPAVQIGVVLTADNCGRGVSAVTHQIARGALSDPERVSLILPDCESVGSIVMIDDHFERVPAARR